MSVNPHRFSLYKRSNLIYYVGYYQEGRRKWKSTGATTKPEALKALTRLRELLQERVRSISLGQFSEEFLAYAKANHSPKSVLLFESVLESFGNLFPKLSLRELTPEHIDKFKTKRLGQKLSPVSVNIELRMLRSALNSGRRWKFLESDLFEGFSFVPVPQQSPVFLTRDDFQKLIERIEENWLREVVTFAVLTGMRRGEITHLKWSDIDLSKRVIHLQTSETFRTKQGKRRTIPLSDTAFYLLKSREGKSPAEYVFTLNDQPIFEGWVTHLFKRYVRDAGLDERLHFHSLRHTFASWLVQDGVSIYEVQKLLGHSSIAVTQVYSHLQPEQLHDTVNRLSVNLN